MLVEELEEDEPVRRALEAGRAVLFDRYHAVEHSDPDVGVVTDGDVSAVSVGATIFAAERVDFGGPRFGDLFHHANVLDRARFHAVEAAIHVAQKHGGRWLVRRRFARNIKNAVFIHDRDAIDIFLDSDKPEVLLGEVPAKRAPHPAISADNIMII